MSTFTHVLWGAACGFALEAKPSLERIGVREDECCCQGVCNVHGLKHGHRLQGQNACHSTCGQWQSVCGQWFGMGVS